MERIFDTHPRLASAVCAIAVVATVYASLGLAAGRADVAGQRSRLYLEEEPKAAESLLAVQKAMVAECAKPNAPEVRDVVITGQIGGMPNVWPELHPAFPWYKDQASFFLVDSKIASQFATHAKQHGGSNHNCAFCQSLAAKNAHAIAVVNFVDEKGEIIRMDTRDLLGLTENQTVIIRGKARLLGGSMLVIDANGVFTRPNK